MNKKLISISILFLVVTILAVFVLINNRREPTNLVADNQTPVKQTSGIVLFYGDGCPHCAIVEEFVAQNNIETQVIFTKKEVYNNSQNANDLASKAKICGMPTDSIGVPFLWDGSKCLVGDQDIIDFFKLKANIQ